jgi:isopenicillin-N epimerase
VLDSIQPPALLRPNLRSEWLLDERITFLNHGSFGAVPRCVFDEQTQWRRRIEAEPVEIIARQRVDLLTRAKFQIGSWLGMRADDFGFVTNATEGINAVLRSLAFRAGDELLTTTHVYNAIRKAMRFVCERSGAGYREIDLPLPLASSQGIADRVLEGISSRTRLVVIDHITSPTALVFPLERIIAECNRRGIDVLVDGAHAPGMVPLDVPALGATYYTGNLHKWAAAPKGTGFLWVRPEKQNEIHPLIVSHHYGEGFVAEFGWQGTRDLAAWLAAPRGLAFMAELGWDRVMSHNHQLASWAHRMLCERLDLTPLSPLDGTLLGSMATLRLPRQLAEMNDAQAQAVQRRLYDEFRIEVPIMQWSGRCFIRPCCQVYNTAAEYERLAEAIHALAEYRLR